MPGTEPAKELERYRLAMIGGGIEELDRIALRDGIRRREILPTTELARAGTDTWMRASEFPELERYFQLAGSAKSAEARVSTERELVGMGRRVVAGLVYPFDRGAFLTVLALALFSYIPLLGLFTVPIASVYVLGIIRESAKGDTRMPGWFDTSDLADVLITWLKTLAVSLIAMWPIVLWTFLWFSTTTNVFDRAALVELAIGLAVAGVVSLVYYPACLATVAVWHSVLDSLNPVYVARVIRTVGPDYFVVVGIWMAVWVGTLLLEVFARALFGWIPLFGGLPARLIGLWGQLYVAHLLGYAIYRHSDELGWS